MESILSQIPFLNHGTELHTVLGLSATQLAAVSIAFNPIYWNVVARTEHRTGLGRATVGPKLGCYLLAVTIFTLGLVRDHLFLKALDAWPVDLHGSGIKVYVQAAGVLSFVVGNILVLSSMYALGVTGTYLGDYFGILMDARVTQFPFDVTDNPMYHGSVLSFLGTSLWYGKSGGLWLTLEVLVMYLLALRFEEPYTAEIYAARDRRQKVGGAKKSS
ncbi:Methylene-fatty-acyl-phospholipid synthase [Taphrina deformans PYCC 5710]|uniref:Phosphatidyl-N-methylethanolamine N-methyltransferase n=1 Tax=Taphrina deformans (strain PYCC 5710 / ATCC 11124 / CBS 356.35 / IMI 108563 / JCM 9778 / NBRC 8474) TaxID=1097556 RepID=R4X6C8_TAPDE|nr:Methylene-fatty-acyl-phospholipid synthase [Taphrina deformans PYCC 5710]|eukprot:CCG80609.1 Methylene-fatty-acyl-phospholipid synthase [Taphrina deformans PYCC 5710]